VETQVQLVLLGHLAILARLEIKEILEQLAKLVQRVIQVELEILVQQVLLGQVAPKAR